MIYDFFDSPVDLEDILGERQFKRDEEGEPVKFRDKDGIEHTRRIKNELKRVRLFYVVQTNLHTKDRSAYNPIVKIGISGNVSGNGLSRFSQYLTYYGINKRMNPCSGVKVYYIYKTRYNENIPSLNTKILKIEKYYKKFFKDNHFVKQGNEWISVDLLQLKDILYKIPIFTDTPFEYRRSNRLEQIRI